MDIIERAKEFIKANRPALVAKAEGLLKGWHGRPIPSGSVVYQLNDQDHFADLYEGMNLTDDEYVEMCEHIEWGEERDPGDLDVWIEAARNLGFTDYVEDLERVKADGL